MAGYQEASERWQAVVTRDPLARGQFFYAVRTTGIYCLNTCGARKPLRGNVVFFTQALEAERKGFRPCKKCKPGVVREDGVPECVIAACRLLDAGGPGQDLGSLARAVEVSPFNLQKLFKKHLGVSPKGYASHKRGEKFRELLEGNQQVTEALYRAGYGSSGRCYENAVRELGMTPGQYRQRGAGQVLTRMVVPSDLGWVGVGATGKGVSVIELGDDRDGVRKKLEDRLPGADWREGSDAIEEWVAAVVRRLQGTGKQGAVPLDIQGTVFQRRVWEALCQIPVGETRTYSELAESLGHPKGARAVAKACGDNPVAVVIPCHRVVGKDGKLRGYRWGLERKRALLAREKLAPGVTAASRRGSARPR